MQFVSKKKMSLAACAAVAVVSAGGLSVTPTQTLPAAAAPAAGNPILIQGRLAPGQNPKSVSVSVMVDGKSPTGATTQDVIARDTVRADGTFAVSMKDVSILKKYAHSSGRVDVEVLIQNATSAASSFVVLETKQGVPKSTQELDPVALTSTAPSPAEVGAARQRAATIPTVDGIAQEVPLERETGTDELAAPTAIGSAAAESAGPPPACRTGWSYVKYLGARKSFVAAHHDNYSGVSHQTTLASGSESKLGVATSVGGKYGSFKVSGEKTTGINSTRTWPASAGDRRDYTYMRYSLYKRRCTFGVQYSAKPTGNSSGTAASSPKTPAAWKCSPYLKGSKEEMDTYSAWRNYGGVDLSTPLGLNVSAESGYTRSVKIKFNFWGNRGRLCGTRSTPNNGSGNIYVARRR